MKGDDAKDQNISGHQLMGHQELTGRALERTNLEFATSERGEAGGR